MSVAVTGVPAKVFWASAVDSLHVAKESIKNLAHLSHDRFTVVQLHSHEGPVLLVLGCQKIFYVKITIATVPGTTSSRLGRETERQVASQKVRVRPMA